MPPLEFDKYYHIYNRGNNRENLFCCEGDYNHFLTLFEKYLYPVADIFTWVLMKNHFHLLIRIKEESEIGTYLPLATNDSIKFQTTGRNNLTESAGPVRVIPPVSSTINSDRSVNSVRLKDPPPTNSDRSVDSVRLKPNPTRHFSHLFNSYARQYNLKYNRSGALFERPFKQIEVSTIEYLRNLTVYIHTNPVHHGFTDDFTNYSWSSYQTILSNEPANLQRQEVINWFNDIENYKAMHQMKIDTQLISNILLE